MIAFSLLNPWMLAGLLLAAIPLMIHLFYRRRYREMQWAAVLFLSGAVSRNAQKNRIQQLLLLALRTLALIALVFGFARPLMSDSLVSMTPETRRHTVFVIDASLSMRCRLDEGTRFDRAVELAKDIVLESREGDSFQLLTIAGAKPGLILGQPTVEKNEVVAALEKLECTLFAGEVRPVWPETLRLLKAASTNADKTVHVLTDLQSQQWNAGTPGTTGSDLSEVAEQATLSFIDVSESQAANLGVGNVRVEQRFVTLNQQTTIRVILQNSDREKAVDRDIRMLVDGLVVATQTVTVNELTRLNIPFQYRAITAGQHRLTFEVDGDRLPDDDRVHHVLNVYDRIPVLLVNGKPSSRHMGNATDFLRISLDPGEEAGWKTPYDVRVVSEVELGSIDPSDYAAVFLCNIRQFTDTESIRLRKYAQAGGAVVVCVGDQSDLQNYNSRLFNDSGLLPGVRMVSYVGNASDPLDAFEFESGNLSHPMMAVYRGNPGHGLEQVLTFQYVKTTLAESSNCQPVLRFKNGDPVIVEAPIGAGTCCLVGIAGDDSRWSTWNTASGTYVSLMNELAEFAVSGRDENRRSVVGERWTRPVVLAAADQSPSAVFDDGTEQPLRIIQDGVTDQVQADPIVAMGFMSLGTAGNQYLVACNTDPAESNLQSLSESAIRERLLPNADFSVTKASGFRLAAGAEQTRANSEGAFMLFVIVVALLIAELLLASRAGFTSWVLFAVACAAVPTLAFLPEIRVPIMVLMTVGAAVAVYFRQRRQSAT